MAGNYEIIKGFQTKQGLGLYDYDHLHNKPGLATQEQAGLLSPEDKKKIDDFNNDDIEFPVISVNEKTGEVILTKEDIGLDKVENKTSEEIRREIDSDNIASALGYVPASRDDINEIDLSDYPNREEVNSQIEGVRVKIDTTLFEPDTAADAAVVGNAIRNLNELVGEKKVSEQIVEAIQDIGSLEISGGFTAQENTPEDTNLLWIDTSDNSVEEGAEIVIEVDDTLTKEGMAADAAAVGQAIQDIVYVGEDGDSAMAPIDADTLGGLHAEEYATDAEVRSMISGLATENFVANKIAEAQLGGNTEIDLSAYATKDELNSLTPEKIGAIPKLVHYYGLNSGVDINTVTNGLFMVNQDQSKNCPIGDTHVYILQIFYSKVASDANRTQIAFPYRNGNGFAYRVCYAGVWGEWNLIYSSKKLPTAAEINAAPTNHTHTTDDISGILPIEKGGTGTYSVPRIANTIFNNRNDSPDYICGFDQGYANIGYTTPIQLRSTLGLGSTLDVLPVENGGTGTDNIADFLYKLHPKNATETDKTYICTFGDKWENGSYVSPQAMRNKMGLGNTSGALPIANGGTGATTAAGAKSAIGLGNVPNVATNDQTPSYTQSSGLAKLVSGEKLSVAFGKIAKTVSDFIEYKVAYVTPQMFGAKGGDGSQDDTEAIRAAINSGFPVFFPAGTYKVTSTIVIDKAVRLYGAGVSNSIIKYTGDGYLFNVSTRYDAPAVFEKLTFRGASTKANSLINCEIVDMENNKGLWGSGIVMRDFQVRNFDEVWLRLCSSYKVSLENGDIHTLGKCQMTTANNDEATTNNFNNCINFYNCYIVNKGTTTSARIDTMFELYNVRQLTFTECALDRCTTIFKDFVPGNIQADSSNVQKIHLDKCWLEEIDYIYNFEKSSEVPTISNSKIVDVRGYDGNLKTNEVDMLDGSKAGYYRNSESSSIESAILNEGKNVFQFAITNSSDERGTFYPYSFKTNEALIKVPLNSVTTESTDGKNLSYKISKIARYSYISGRFKAIVFARYANDNNVSIWEADIFCYNKNYYPIKTQKIYSNGTIGTESLKFNTSDHTLTFTTDTKATKLFMTINYELNSATKI